MQLQFIPQPIKDEATREFFTNDFVKKWIPRGMGHSDISVKVEGELKLLQKMYVLYI